MRSHGTSHFLFYLRCGALAAVFFFLAPSVPAFPASPATRAVSSPPEEDFVYDIDFLWFKKMAEGRLSIRRTGPKRYRADLVARTKGFIGFLTSYRKNHYISEMEFLPDKNRLLSRRYTKTVHSGLDVSKSVTVIDYKKGEIRWETTTNGEIRDKGTEPIPKGLIYEDLLSALFNLRFGAFGPMTHGRQLTITTLPAYASTEEGEVDFKKEFVRNFHIRISCTVACPREHYRDTSRSIHRMHNCFDPCKSVGGSSYHTLWYADTTLPWSSRLERNTSPWL